MVRGIERMLADFRQLDDGLRLEADLCIIGAGAAGISIARTFTGSGVKVVVLESGSRDFDPEIQALYEGECVGQPYDLEATRLRFFGGTTNHWQSICGLLDDIDFEARSWVPHSGWPIARPDLAPFYEPAGSIIRLAPFLDGVRALDRIGAVPLPFDRTKLRYGFRQDVELPVRFGEEFESDLNGARNIQLLFHANATNIVSEADGGRVRYVDFRTLNGKTGRVSARHYVLACGVIENARLLLVSNAIEPAGVGNRHDWVGRCFMEHPNFLTAEVISDDYEALQMPAKWLSGIKHETYLKATPELLARLNALNSLIQFDVIPKTDSGMVAARSIYFDLAGGRNIDRLGEKAWRVLTDLDDVVSNAYGRFVLGERTRFPVERLEIRVRTEQAPDPDSRVTLASEKDALDLNKVRLDWRISEQEVHTAENLAKTVGTELGRLGLARIKLDEAFVTKDRLPEYRIGNHQYGTTRMAADPRKGVVDRDCRVHGIDNLYVAGSSVFPTAGYMNPTLTIVALALRLASHLKEQLA